MQLISEISIDSFRSLSSAKLENPGDFTVLAGLNNSGKSNVLRALNAFFTGQTDIGVPLKVDEDYFRPHLRKKKAKRIRISVKFSLPPVFRFRAGLQGVQEFLGGQVFELGKEWDRLAAAARYFLNGEEVGVNDRGKVDQFLSLLSFRYIPNRVLPLDVIRKEHQSLRDVLIRRLATRGRGKEQAFEEIKKTSAGLIKGLAFRVHEACPEVGDVRLATPSSWREMVFAFGYKLVSGEVEVDDFAQGSGVQSLLMLETLSLIDRDYFQQFGWKQASIWAVEEPESSLHSSLEARVAAYHAGPESTMAAHRVVAADVVGCSADRSEGRSVAAHKKNWGGYRNPTRRTSAAPCWLPRMGSVRLGRYGFPRDRAAGWLYPGHSGRQAPYVSCLRQR
jgi:hypothetical protein